MNQNHYPSLELCKKLTEMGFPKTEKCYNDAEIRNDIEYTRDAEYNVCPSIAELLDELKEKVICIESIQDWVYEVSVQIPVLNRYESDFQWTLPNALASMYIWLKDNNYLK